MAKIDTLAVEFSANYAQFNKGMEQVRNKLVILQKVIQKVSLKAAEMFVRPEISRYVEQATAVGQLSESIGESAEEVQAWSQAVKSSNGNAETFWETLQSLSDSLNLMSLGEDSPLIGYLNRLNINFKNIDGSIKKPLQLLKELADRFEGMSNARSMSIGKRLGLDEGTIRLLQKGSNGMAELIDKSKALGVYTDNEIETANKLSQSFQDFTQALDIFKLKIASFFIPAINKAVTGLTTLLSMINKNERAVKAFVLVALIVSLLKAIPVLSIFAKALWISLLPIMALIASLVLLGLAFEDAFSYLEGGESITGSIAQWFSDAGFEVENFIKKIFDLFKNIGFAFEDFIKYLISLLVDGIKSTFERLVNLWKSAKGFFVNLLEGGDGLNINAVPSSIPQDALNSSNSAFNNVLNQNFNIGTVDVRADKVDASNIVSTPVNEIKRRNLVNMADRTLNG